MSIKTKSVISLILFLLSTAGLIFLLTSCGGGGNGQESGATESGQEEDVLLNDKTDFTLQTKSTEAGIQIRDGRVVVTSLKTAGGKELVHVPETFALPASYEKSGADSAFDWQYIGYKRHNCGRSGRGYIFLYEDAAASFTYELYVVARPDLAGPFEFFGYLINQGKRALTVSPDDYFRVNVEGPTAPMAWTFRKESGIAEGWTIYDGQSFPGSGIYQSRLTAGEKAVAYARVDQNWNDSGDIPMMYLEYGKQGIYFALEWTNGKLTATGFRNGASSLTVCLADGNFRTQVPAGEALYLPSVYLGAYDGDVDDGSNQFKHWFMACKAPENLLEDPNEPLTQQDMQLGYDVAKYGIQQIKWDYGWWSDEVVTGQWRTNEGLLEVHNSAYLGVLKGANCMTLKSFSSKAAKAGVKMTLYCLLKDTQLERSDVPTSVGKYGHPEWFSHICITGVANSADLGNTACVDFFKQYMFDFFNYNKITTWRSDFEPICRASDKKNRHFANGNDVQYWCTVGFGELVDYLTENLTDFRYESCSSGGSMKDFFTMSKASVIQCEDASEFMSAHMTFYDSSYCIPPAQLQLAVNALTFTPGSKYYAGVGDYLYGFRCVLTGGVMLSSWAGPSEEDISYWPYYVDNLYNKVMKPLIKYGDLYHILPRPDGIHWDGLEYIDADSENEIKGLVMLWKPTDTEGPNKTVFLRGLHEDTLYDLRFEDRPEQNCRKSGAELMKNGLTVTIGGESGSEMIWISEAK